VNRTDWVFFMGAGLGILCFGIIQGIVIGVVLSLLLLIARSSRTSVRELRRSPTTGTYHEAQRHEGLEAVPGVLVVRVDGPLFFADADRFRTTLENLVPHDATPQAVVIDAESIYLTDTDGADILSQVAEELGAQGTALSLAAVHPPVLELWQRGGAIDAIGANSVFETVHEAVRAVNERIAVNADARSPDPSAV
jgi:SulP family sulfate permease